MEALVYERKIVDIWSKYMYYKGNLQENTMKIKEFVKKYGEGTDFDLDWGKLAILALCVYIAVQVS